MTVRLWRGRRRAPGGARGRRLLLTAAALATVAVAAAAPVGAAGSAPGTDRDRPPREASVTIQGADAPGPARYDRVRVLQVGRADARQVLVLLPGQGAAAGSLRLVARDLARRLPGTQVWVVDRREQGLADLSRFRGGDPDLAAGYYLGGHYRQQDERTAPFARDWGLRVQLEDLRRVVLAARDGGRRQVVLGGHSWGGSTALHYAAWDFAGRPGYRDLAGLVLIDGGVHDSFAGEGIVYRVTPEEAAARLREIAAGAPFQDVFGMGRSESGPILFQLAGLYAATAPRAPSALRPLLPEALRPPVPVTNRALLGWLFDASGLSPDLKVHSGRLATEGEVRDWLDDGPSPIARVAEVIGGPVPAPFEWYWPNRLTLDLEAADPYAETPVTRLLGLRLRHARQVDVPLYVFETGLTKGSSVEAARWVVEHSRIPRATYVRDDALGHVDPLVAAPQANTFLGTVVPFLATLR